MQIIEARKEIWEAREGGLAKKENPEQELWPAAAAARKCFGEEEKRRRDPRSFGRTLVAHNKVSYCSKEAGK